MNDQEFLKSKQPIHYGTMENHEAQSKPLLDYQSASFSAGRMAFTWGEWTAEARAAAHADWAAGRGLIGGDPRHRPNSHLLPGWGIDQPFFRTLALADERGRNGATLRAALATAPRLEIEIGYGRGDFLLDRAQRYPQTLFIGYETKTKATRLCLARIARLGLTNLWLSDDDCRFSLPRLLADHSVDLIHILFPDPWWKEQHQVKRLFSPPFVDLLGAKLRPGGLLFFKSDVAEYGNMVCALVEEHPVFGPQDPTLAADIGPYVPTHREYWCQQQALPIAAYYFRRASLRPAPEATMIGE